MAREREYDERREKVAERIAQYLSMADFEEYGGTDLDRVVERIVTNPDKHLSVDPELDFQEDVSGNYQRVKDEFGLRTMGEIEHLLGDADQMARDHLEAEIEEQIEDYGLENVVDAIDRPSAAPPGLQERVESVLEEYPPDVYHAVIENRITNLASILNRDLRLTEQDALDTARERGVAEGERRVLDRLRSELWADFDDVEEAVAYIRQRAESGDQARERTAEIMYRSRQNSETDHIRLSSQDPDILDHSDWIRREAREVLDLADYATPTWKTIGRVRTRDGNLAEISFEEGAELIGRQRPDPVVDPPDPDASPFGEPETPADERLDVLLATDEDDLEAIGQVIREQGDQWTAELARTIDPDTGPEHGINEPGEDPDYDRVDALADRIEEIPRSIRAAIVNDVVSFAELEQAIGLERTLPGPSPTPAVDPDLAVEEVDPERQEAIEEFRRIISNADAGDDQRLRDLIDAFDTDDADASVFTRSERRTRLFRALEPADREELATLARDRLTQIQSEEGGEAWRDVERERDRRRDRDRRERDQAGRSAAGDFFDRPEQFGPTSQDDPYRDEDYMTGEPVDRDPAVEDRFMQLARDLGWRRKFDFHKGTQADSYFALTPANQRKYYDVTPEEWLERMVRAGNVTRSQLRSRGFPERMIPDPDTSNGGELGDFFG